MRSTLLADGSIICMVKFTSLGMWACNRGTEQGEAGMAPRSSKMRSGAAVWRPAAKTPAGLIATGLTPVGDAPEFCESIELTMDCQPETLPLEAGDCAQSIAAIANSSSKILIQATPGSVYP